MQLVGLMVKVIVTEVGIANRRAAFIELAPGWGKKAVFLVEQVFLLVDELQKRAFYAFFTVDDIATTAGALSAKRVPFSVDQFPHAGF